MNIRIDPHSATWLSIKAYCEERMTDYRSRLESNISYEETQQLRSRLGELKGILALTQVETPVIEADFELPG